MRIATALRGRAGRRRLVAALMGVTVAVAALPVGVSAGGPVDLLPDLRMRQLSRFHLQTVSGHRRLLFDTIIVNDGRGALEITGRRACSSLSTCPTMDVKQGIHRSNGTVRYVAADGHMRYAGDGHNHWHVQKIESYEIFARDAGQTLRKGVKRGYCFFDNVAHNLSLPGAPQHRVWGESGCGTSSSLTTRVGLSVGWGDLYPWNFVWQWIDITGLSPGDYRVCVTADLGDRYQETIETNNNVWQDITLTSSGFRLGAHGWNPCRAGIGGAGSGTTGETAAAADPGAPSSDGVARAPQELRASPLPDGSTTCRVPGAALGDVVVEPGWDPAMGTAACRQIAPGVSAWPSAAPPSPTASDIRLSGSGASPAQRRATILGWASDTALTCSI
jgi:hypothetical protein